MPVTARLSQKFYERLGEEVANDGHGQTLTEVLRAPG
jgi:hypothetical protein